MGTSGARTAPKIEDDVRQKKDEANLRCPICGKPAAEPAPADVEKRSPRPFCSERCRLIDLGRWLDGEYQIPAEELDLDEADIKPIRDNEPGD